MAGTRVYAVVDTHLAPTEQQCVALFQTAAGYPLATAIQQVARAAHNRVTASKRSLGAGFVRRATMLGFEIDSKHVAAIINIVDEQAALRGIVEPVNAARFRLVLEAEIQDAARDNGFSEPIASGIEVTPWVFDDRESAIATAQAYLAANAAVWAE